MKTVAVMIVVVAGLAACKDSGDKASPTGISETSKKAGGIDACNEYGELIGKLATCERLPAETRAKLKEAYEKASGAWGSVPPEAQPAIAKACKAAVSGLRAALRACN